MSSMMAVCVMAAVLVAAGGALAEGKGPVEIRTAAKSSDADYYAFPSVCRTKAGELLCVFYLGTGHISPDGKIAMVRSTDEGRTWTQPEVIIDTPLDDRDPSICQTRSGRVIVNFFTYVYERRGESRATRDSIRVHTAVSDDGGKTFGKPKPLSEDWTWSATSDEIIQLADGTLLLPIYGRKLGDKTDRASVAFSTDDGNTWSDPITIAYDSGGKIDFQEPAFVLLPSGEIWCSLRTTNVGYHAYECRSTDGGKTWTSPIDTLLHGHAAGLLYHSSGVVFQAYRSWSHTGKIRGVAGVFREPGKPWNPTKEFDIMVVGGDSAYPSPVELSDGSILCVYYAREHRAIEAAVISPEAIRGQEK